MNFITEQQYNIHTDLCSSPCSINVSMVPKNYVSSINYIALSLRILLCPIMEKVFNNVLVWHWNVISLCICSAEAQSKTQDLKPLTHCYVYRSAMKYGSLHEYYIFHVIKTFMCAGIEENFKKYLNSLYYQKDNTNNYSIISNKYYSILSDLKNLCC